MKLQRILRVCCVLAMLAAGYADDTHAQGERTRPGAQDYPQKPIRWLIGFAPGGGQTVLVRLAGQKLTERWGVSIIVDNRPGAGGTIAMDLAANAPPDGYTVLNLSSSMAINAGLITKVSFNIHEAYAPVTRLTSQPYLLVAHPSLPAKNIKELIALARASPGKLNYGSSGTGSLGHLAMELFNHMAKIQITHVPYKGTGQTLIDLLGGQIGIATSSIIAAVPHIKTGRLRALAVTTSRRSSILPEVPAIAESGLAGYGVDGWYGLVVPRNVPQEIVAKLNREIGGIMALPDVRAALLADGAEPASGTPAEFQATIADEIKKWTNLVRTSGVRLN